MDFNYYQPFTKKRKNISLGIYPERSLAQARKVRDEYRSLLAQDIDPAEYRANQLQATLNRAQIKLQTRYLILWQLLTMTRPNEAAMARYEDIDEKRFRQSICHKIQSLVI